MARYKCPCCGSPYNGKRCRECCYEPFSEEIAHRGHTHEGEPLVVTELPTREVVHPGKNAAGPKNRDPYPGKRKNRKPVGLRIAVLCVVFLLCASQLQLWDAIGLEDIWEEAHSDLSLALPDIDTEEPEMPDRQDGIVLFEDQDVLILADWQEGTAFDPADALTIYIRNDSGQDLAVSSNQLCVNGYMASDSFFYGTAESGTVSANTLRIYEEELQQAGIETVAQIGLRLYLYDTDTYNPYAESAYITLSFDTPEDFVQKTDDSGAVLYEKDGIKITYRGYEGSDCEDLYLWFYMENATDMTMQIYASEIYVNGEPTGPYLWAELLPSTRTVTSMWMYCLPEDVGVETADGIETLELVFDITDSTAWADMIRTDRINVDIHE